MKIVTNVLLAKIGAIINFKNHSYKISNEEIKDGDLVWNEPSKSVDECVKVIGDDIVVQFESGLRAVLCKKRFQKLVLKR
jgi:polyhydroxyalkanoate synthesis regulator phasin